MQYYFIVVFVAITIASIPSKTYKYGLETSFLLLTLFIGLRFEYFGLDTHAYMLRFERLAKININPFDLATLHSYEPNVELGWLAINYWFKSLGWCGFQLLIVSIENYIIYKNIKQYVPSKYYWLSIVIFAFNKSFMLIGACSMMRQWLAMMIIVYASKYIVKRKLLNYTFWVLIAFFIHKTSIIAWPCYFIIYINKIDFSWKAIPLLCLLYYIWFSVALEYTSYIDMFIASSDEYAKYGVWGGEMEQTKVSIMGFCLMFLIPLLSFIRFKELNPFIKFSCFMCLIGLLFLGIEGYSQIIGRLGLYFSIFSIFLFPSVIHSVESAYPKKYLHLFLILIITVGYIKEFCVVINQEPWDVAFKTYEILL